MKMTTLRDQSKPILYGLVILFTLAMGNFGEVFSSANPNRGDSENCDPSLFIACSDDENITMSVDMFNQRFENNIDFWLRQATFNSQFNAIDKQLDTLNAKNRVWNSILNEQINGKFINELNLLPTENYSLEMIAFIKNYPNFNNTYKMELESYGIFMTDSLFDQNLYEASVDDGMIDNLINENFELNNPLQAQILFTRGTNRWNNWVSTMKRQIASSRLNLVLNSIQSLSNLELKEQFKLDNSEYNFDYISFNLNEIDSIEISKDQLNSYFEEIKDDNLYNLKTQETRIVEFVKWNTTELDGESKDSIKKLAKDFRKLARKEGFENAVNSISNYSLHREVELVNDFSTSKSGLASQVTNSDSTQTTALYNLIGAGRRIINFAFNNDVGEIKLINIDSDRETDGFSDIGVFHIKDVKPSGYISLNESSTSERLINELNYIKKIEIAKNNFQKLIDSYEEYIQDEGYDNLSSDDLKDFDPLDQWISSEEGVSEKLLLRNHTGTINDFLASFINTDLRNLSTSDEEIKAIILSSNLGLNYHMFAIDNENICVIRINEKPDEPTSEQIAAYKESELQRLSNSAVSIFIQDQKETANIKDNRNLVY